MEAGRDLGAVGQVLVGVECGWVARVGADERGHTATAANDVVGRGDRRLLLSLLRAVFLRIGLFGLLLRLVLHGLLLLTLLHGLLLLTLLLGDLCGGRLTVVIIVSTADQRQTGRAHAGSGGCAKQRAARHLSPAHPLPIVSLAHSYLLRRERPAG